MAAEAWMWLASGLGFGAVNSGEVLSAYPGGPDEILENLGSNKMDELLTAKQADRLAATRPQDFALRVAHAQTVGVHTVGYGDVKYPAALRNISNPPPVLFIKGDLTLMNGQLSIGMVGARRPSAYGVEVVKAVGRGVALGGAIIVSGLAAGLDAEAHKAALAVNGPTIACIAFGHDHCYPAANKKLMELIERHGAVVSEYPLGTSPEKPFFLHRNRIIAGISHGLVVVEARKHSGTMSTVNFATDYGRDVFAVPGSIFSELSGGTNAMIREGAYLAGSAGDVLAVYGIELPGEDPVAAAAKQAAAGRPTAAEAAPPWQQSLSRFAARPTEEAPREELPGQQTLGEVLRSRLGAAEGRVSAGDAVDAFRELQKTMPPTTDSELDARNAMLDEMVAAVSDSVEISAPRQQSGQPPTAAKKQNKGEVAPFPWERVERVEKENVASLSSAKESAQPTGKGKKPSLASRLLSAEGTEPRRPAPGEGAAPQATAAATPAVPGTRARPVQPVGRVSGVGRVQPVYPVAPVQAVAPPAPAEEVTPTQVAAAEPPQRRSADQQAAAARQSAEKPKEKKPTETSLAGRLRTIPTPPAPDKDNKKERGAATLQSFTGKAPPAPQDPRELLSDNAKKALGQLGPKPAALADVCERSGLSLAEAMAALTELELAGLSRQLAGRQFVMADV